MSWVTARAECNAVRAFKDVAKCVRVDTDTMNKQIGGDRYRLRRTAANTIMVVDRDALERKVEFAVDRGGKVLVISQRGLGRHHDGFEVTTSWNERTGDCEFFSNMMPRDPERISQDALLPLFFPE